MLRRQTEMICSRTCSWPIFVLVISLLMQGGNIQAFKLISSTSLTHYRITREAILNATANVCRSLVQQEGGLFAIQTDQLSVESLSEACSFTGSVKTFQISIGIITNRNAWVDLQHVLDEEYHFDDESFLQGKSLITKGLASIKANIKQRNFMSARLTTGAIMHTLQDFYSHSNWVELGNTFAYTNLIRAELNIDNIADTSTPTCRSCVGDNCDNNILETIITEKKLTSGYFNLFSSNKPEGKCSHGGGVDQTSDSDPTGGINKDGVESEHGSLHTQAAQVAIAATSELLQDIRSAVGDTDFLQLLGIIRSSSASIAALTFVVDISSSMASVLADLKEAISSILTGNISKASSYILVTFSDTGFGPLISTTDLEDFLSVINNLSANEGGSSQVASQIFAALQLALSQAPSLSEIFAFTDAPPSDSNLESTVLALIENTKSEVSFFLTTPGKSNQRSNEVYQSLAMVSGGQAIVTTEAQLSQAVSIITASLSSQQATIFQAFRDRGGSESFSFTIDNSVKNLTVYITGTSPEFTITSASGTSQSSNQTSGSLGTIQTVGNLKSIQMSSVPQEGQWKIDMTSSPPYTIKVIGETLIDFVYDVVEVFQSSQRGFITLDSRPPASGNASFSITLTGGSSVSLTEVALISVSGSNEVQGVIEETDSDAYLVTMTTVPEGSFFLRVRGRNASSNVLFQRQSTNQLQASAITISAENNMNWAPGSDLSIPFNVTTSNTTAGNYTIKARNDRGFSSSAPTSVTLTVEGRAEGTVTLTAPADTPSGTEVTLTIEAEAPGASDSNYAILRLAVNTDVTDTTPPVCEVVKVNSNCSGNCSLETWDFSASVSDGTDGSGIERVTISEGLGNLTTTSSSSSDSGGQNITLAFFSASCCSEEVILLMVDGVGNVGSCTVRSDGTRYTPLPLPLWVSVYLSVILSAKMVLL